MSDRPPRRPSSTEMTAVLPRFELAPIAESTVDREAETMVDCPWCDGHAMVSVKQRNEWLQAHPELSAKRGESVVDDTVATDDDGDR